MQQIRETRLPDHALALWALGQEGFLVKYGETKILFDPYLTNWVFELAGEPWSRRFVSPLAPEDCEEIDYVIISHHHEDHMDKQTLQALSRHEQTKFIVPRAHLSLIRSWGIREEQLIGISHLEIVELSGDLSLEAHAAMHEQLEQNEEGEHLYLGYVLSLGDIRLYHSGDTIGFPELVAWLQVKQADIAMLPINGRDYVRRGSGIAGNTNYREAVDIGAAIGADLLIPMHFGLFPHNDENPAYFVDYLYSHYPEQRFHMFTPGERFIYMK